MEASRTIEESSAREDTRSCTASGAGIEREVEEEEEDMLTLEKEVELRLVWKGK